MLVTIVKPGHAIVLRNECPMRALITRRRTKLYWPSTELCVLGCCLRCCFRCCLLHGLHRLRCCLHGLRRLKCCQLIFQNAPPLHMTFRNTRGHKWLRGSSHQYHNIRVGHCYRITGNILQSRIRINLWDSRVALSHTLHLSRLSHRLLFLGSSRECGFARFFFSYIL